jgi:hypothetical protein
MKEGKEGREGRGGFGHFKDLLLSVYSSREFVLTCQILSVYQVTTHLSVLSPVFPKKIKGKKKTN